jgi:curved DNA-binding protein CbpA
MGVSRLYLVPTPSSFLRLNFRFSFQLPLTLHCKNQRIGYATQTSSSSADHYNTLNISPNASRKDIKHAYYKLSKQYHPDVNTDENAHVKFRQIQEAYDVLGDARLKAEYDQRFRSYNPENASGGGGGGFTRQDFKRRDGAQFHGRSDAYNYDEHFREHYGKAVRKPPPSRAFYNSASQSQEDLRKYWARRENEINTSFGEQERTRVRFGFVIRFMLVNLALAAVYFSLEAMRQRER